jgi:DNA repair protein RadC
MLPQDYIARNTIKDWSVQDRPREKLLQKGRKSLSDAELLAIVLGSGTANESALSVAQRIMAAANHNLFSLSQVTYHDLLRFKGVGPAKAVNILAVLEIASRINNTAQSDVVQISCSADIYKLMKKDFAELPVEEFWLLLLNTANRVIKKHRIAIGGVSGVVADIRVILKSALDHSASGLVIAHNHPSGNRKASKQDIDLTHRLKDAAKLMDISLLDHLIFCGGHYVSLADDGIL